MKFPNELEIRIAVIGYVSVGKTTVLNALLKDKFSEVSMKRTTAGINIFRLSVDQTQNEDKDDSKSNKGASTWSPEEYRSAKSTLEEITNDNKVLRESNCLQEKSFDIVLDEPLFRMRRKTRLVLIDVPGINEAGTSDKYKDYVSKNWHTFDCVIVVLDGLQGVNTEEQVQVLKFAQDKCENEKLVPLIILLNKVDDIAFDEEHQVLVQEATEAIERLFHSPNREKSLEEIVKGKAKAITQNMASHTPIVIPLSARHAYIFRLASTLTLDQFKTKIEESLVNKLGHDYFGRQWRKYSKDERYKRAHQVIQDKKQYNDGMKDSRFDQFLSALAYCVGGAPTQEWLIQNQIKAYMQRLHSNMDYVEALQCLYDRGRAVGKQLVPIHSRFMELHSASVEDAFHIFTSPSEVDKLAKPMNELFAYNDLVKHMGILDEKVSKEILAMARKMVLRQMDVVLSKMGRWNDDLITHFDRMLIASAMLGGAENLFYEQHKLGIPRLLLEKMLHDSLSTTMTKQSDVNNNNCPKCNRACSTYNNAIRCKACSTYFEKCSSTTLSYCYNCNKRSGGYNRSLSVAGRCSSCHWTTTHLDRRDPLEYKLVDDNFVAANQDVQQTNIHVAEAESLDDPKHFGHLIWQFRNLVEITNALRAPADPGRLLDHLLNINANV